MKKTLLSMLAFSLLVSCSESAESDEKTEEASAPSIEGAWEITNHEFNFTDTSGTWNPYKSIYIFTDKYYSIEIARKDRPSWHDLEEGEERNADDIANAYNGLVSNSGSYEIVGDSIIYSIVVAKSPNFMNDEPRNSNHITIEKDKIFFNYKNDDGWAKTTLERIK